MRQPIRLVVTCIFALLAATDAGAFDTPAPPIAAHGTLQVAFAPWDNIVGLIVDTISNARKQVLVQAYLLTSKEIAAALIAAAQRGVDVRVLADAEQAAKVTSSKLPELAGAGIPIWLETKYQNAHNKIMVIDANSADATVITGSFNFTWAAQHQNAENVLIARKNHVLAAHYAANWERQRQDAIPYKK